MFDRVDMHVIHVALQIVSSTIKCSQYRLCHNPRSFLRCLEARTHSPRGMPRENPALINIQRVAKSLSFSGSVG
jgi:hypothetical protein